jgi:hypothetical protein
MAVTVARRAKMGTSGFPHSDSQVKLSNRLDIAKPM